MTRERRLARGSRPERGIDPDACRNAIARALAAPEIRADRVAALKARIDEASWAQEMLARDLPDSLLDALLG